jgi:hypothetical protein|tara:strand:+ start:27 stop:221 length:195 start_codon:yes stop_codon:yes gene_type:complete
VFKGQECFFPDKSSMISCDLEGVSLAFDIGDSFSLSIYSGIFGIFSQRWVGFYFRLCAQIETQR